MTDRDPPNDADAIARLQQLIDEQVERATAPGERKPGSVDAAIAIIEAMQEDVNRRIEEQLARAKALAKDEHMSNADLLAAYSELWRVGDEPVATKFEEIPGRMAAWVRKTMPDMESQESAFAEALKKMRRGDAQ